MRALCGQMRRTVVAVAAALVLLASTLHADLRERIDALLGTKTARRMSVGVRVTLMPKGEVLYSFRAGELFLPASNVKLVSTASALCHLGADFNYHTLFWTDGALDEKGVLRGDLIIQGDGDPNLSGRFHRGDVTALPRMWSDILRRRGIRFIEGDLVADDRIFDREYICKSWPANQLHKWYAAGAGGLGFNDNCLDITVSPTTSGKPVRVSVTPPNRYARIVNRCVTTSSAKVARRKPFYVTRRPGANTVLIGGTLRAGTSAQTANVTVDAPPLFMATVFAEALRRAGIPIGGTVRLADVKTPRVDLDDRRLLIIHTSKLRDTIKVANRNSQGVYAESLLKRAGAARYGKGTYVTGLRAAAAMLEGMGMKPGSYVMADGSGLSRLNRFSPTQFTVLLQKMYSGEHASTFVNSLARCGASRGTLRKRLTEPEYRGRIAAKTGYLDGVVTISGYAFNRNGKALAFSILMNNVRGSYAAKRIADDVCRALVDEPVP